MKITHRLLDPASDTDMFLIRWACLAPNNVPFGAEDGFDWESWTPSHTGVKYIASYVNCVYVGICALIGCGPIVEAHMAYLPEIYGISSKVGKSQLDWIFYNTEVEEVQAPCLDCNALAKKLILSLGFRPLGVADKMWKKGGEGLMMTIYSVKRRAK